MTETFDPAGYQLDDIPPIPMVIRWNELDPAGYEHTLTALADWITWLQTTYRIPATVIPPCWYAHPGHVEDLGHLWTGWLLTRHPDAGVGMIGLDWDSRRDQTIPRLREATATTGCTTTRHHPDTPHPPVADHEMWLAHLGKRNSNDRS